MSEAKKKSAVTLQAISAPSVPVDRSANGDRPYLRLALPPAAKSSRHVKRLVASFRRRVEAELVEVHGSISAMAAKRLRTACKALMRAMECDRVLTIGLPGEAEREIRKAQEKLAECQRQRDGLADDTEAIAKVDAKIASLQAALAVLIDRGTITHEQWQAYSDRSVRFEEACDKALSSLGLESKRSRDVWDAVYAQTPNATDAAPTSDAASDGVSDLPGAEG